MQEKRKHGKKPRISEEAAAILVVSQPHGVPIIGTAPMDVLPRSRKLGQGSPTPKVQKCGKIGKSAPLLYKAEHLSRRKEKVPRDGIEPPTPAFSGPRSTI